MHHFPPKTEQHLSSYDDIEPSTPSVTIIPANVQDNNIQPPIPFNLPPHCGSVQPDNNYTLVL